jgi:hypothetical protein
MGISEVEFSQGTSCEAHILNSGALPGSSSSVATLKTRIELPSFSLTSWVPHFEQKHRAIPGDDSNLESSSWPFNQRKSSCWTPAAVLNAAAWAFLHVLQEQC